MQSRPYRWRLNLKTGAVVEGPLSDTITEFGGVRVVVDPASAPMLIGASLDYKDGLNEAGFAITNPNAQRSCGCGKSFS